MKTTRLLLIVLASIACWCCGPAGAQPDREGSKVDAGADSVDARKSRAAVRLTVDRFFSGIARGEIDSAYKELTKNSKLADKVDEIKALKEKTRQAAEMFGEIVGSELVEEENVGMHLTRMTYISFGKNYPLRWRFYFYRPDETWRLIDIRVDDSLLRMFGDQPEEGSGQ